MKQYIVHPPLITSPISTQCLCPNESLRFVLLTTIVLHFSETTETFHLSGSRKHMSCVFVSPSFPVFSLPCPVLSLRLQCAGPTASLRPLALCLCCQCFIQDVLDLDHHPPGDSASLPSLFACSLPFSYLCERALPPLSLCSLSSFQVNSSPVRFLAPGICLTSSQIHIFHIWQTISIILAFWICICMFTTSVLYTTSIACLSVPIPPLK